MVHVSIVDLERAVADHSQDVWLARIPDPGMRARIRRAIQIDRRLWTQFPDSLASCLMARTFGDPDLAELHSAWSRELDARDTPWIRPLRALPTPPGLLAELHESRDFPLAGLGQVSFESDELVTLVATRFHPSAQPPNERRRDRLRWSWQHGKAVIELDPGADEPVVKPTARTSFPRVEGRSWEPPRLLLSSARAIELPCPEGSSSDARFTKNGSRLLVYGSFDDYAGGFLWVINPTTLAIERKLATRRPVRKVLECERPDLLLVPTFGELIAWIGDRSHTLLPHASEVALAPSGQHFATLDGGRLRIWSIAGLIDGGEATFEAASHVCFDPSGSRLLSGAQIFDGLTGRPIAHLRGESDGGVVIEGAPARPTLHFGLRYLIINSFGLLIRDASTSEPIRIEDNPVFGHWQSLAYERQGTLLAVLRNGARAVELRELPSARVIRTVVFDIEGSAIAMSLDGSTLALQRDGEVEVRTIEGALPQRFGRADPKAKPAHWPYSDVGLRFSNDGRRLARFLERDGWRIWSLSNGEEQFVAGRDTIDEVADFAPPRPKDWFVESGAMTVFSHRPSGVRIAMPLAGPSACNPADTRILAFSELHVELRAH